MTTFLLMISFLLHVVTLAAIYYLYQQSKSNGNRDSKEMMERMETYVEEIKEENIRLQTLIQSSKPKESIDKPQPIAPREPNKPEDKMGVPSIENIEVEDQMETSLEAKVLQLYQKGYTITEIAKQLNCGKTEAELIIQLHKKSI